MENKLPILVLPEFTEDGWVKVTLGGNLIQRWRDIGLLDDINEEHWLKLSEWYEYSAHYIINYDKLTSFTEGRIGTDGFEMYVFPVLRRIYELIYCRTTLPVGYEEFSDICEILRMYNHKVNIVKVHLIAMPVIASASNNVTTMEEDYEMVQIITKNYLTHILR